MSKMMPEAAQALCDVWNERWPVGTAVTLIRDLGERTETKTRSKAQVAASGDPVVFLEGESGYWLLQRCVPSRIRITVTNGNSDVDVKLMGAPSPAHLDEDGNGYIADHMVLHVNGMGFSFSPVKFDDGSVGMITGCAELDQSPSMETDDDG